ncbi:Regulator of chromosome condensation (RCC1) repeat [Musa troglodytarum]|uniref:Regulator of chromosome condensation (RCC1) repeat n=1 Tax=Musa troglodytarum TaxID=320322 RepID=A0A9E7FBS1_9LILI|nr:Regulator of chromosome condensation (RCC1) repeat [Musa troglodytarum]
MSMEEEGSGGEVAAPAREVLLISAGASHSVALLSGNAMCSWGRGEDGQLGHGDAEDRLFPTILSALDSQGIVSVTCGADHTTAYSESDDQVYSWGWGDFGRLGHGNSSDVFTPQPIKALQGLKIKQIACGDSHCLAVTMDGELGSEPKRTTWSWHNRGLSYTTKDSSISGLCDKMIAAGAEHTAAVTEDGDLYGWGWGRYGNLGLGDRNDRLIPEKVASIKMVLVACGWRHTITVSSSGNLYTYGWSKYGQLGHGDFEDHLSPQWLEALKDSCISQISGGWRHTMALTSDGRLYGWGWNKKVKQISCGWRHTLALTERGNVFSWGRGTSGQLGHGDIVDRNIPKMIEVISKDGLGCKQIESSKFLPSSGKIWVSPSERYAIVPDENIAKHSRSPIKGNGSDANVPENDVKRMRV